MTTLKSKFAKASLGLIAGASLLIAAGSAMAADTFTRNLTVGSRGADVTALQTMLGVSPATGYFGNITKAAVIAYQTSHSISPAAGYIGPITRSVLNANGGVSGNFPAGCSSASGFSSTTGLPCSSNQAATFAPTGCTSASGFSPVTGGACYAVNSGPQTGPVTVSLSNDNPASGNVVAGQATADLAHFTFSGTGTITAMTLQRTGISSSSDLPAVYLYDGGTRVSDSASVNTNGVIAFNGLNIMVSGSKTLSVKADIASGFGGTVGVTLTSFTAGGTTTTVSIAGNAFYGISGTLAGVSITGSVSPASATNVNAGTTGYVFWSDSVQVNTRAVILKSASFRAIGSAPADALTNIRLYVNGIAVGTAGMINSNNYVSFDLMSAPVTLNTGSTLVEVRADVQKGSSRTIQFSLQNAGDLMVTDNQLGVNVAVCTSSCGTGSASFSPIVAGIVTINPGSVTVSIDPAFQAMTNVTGGAANATIAKFKLHAYGEDVKVMSLPVSINDNLTGAATGTGLNNVALYFNGSQVGSSQSFTGTGTVALTAFQLGSSMIIPAGTDSTLEVRADIQSSTSATYTGGTVSVTLPAQTANAQGQNSFNAIGVPASAVTSNALTVSTGTLTVAKNANYLNQTVNANMSNVKIGSFTVQNNSSSESVRLTNLAVGLGFAAPTFTSSNQNTSTTATSQTWTLSSNAGITAGNVVTISGNSSCGATAPVMTVASLSSTTGIVGTITLSSTNCTSATGTIVGSGTTTGPATVTNVSNLSVPSITGTTPIGQPTTANNYPINITLMPGESKTVDVYADLGNANMGAITPTLTVTALGSSSNVTVLQNGSGTAVSGQVITLGAGTLATPTLVTSTTTNSQYVASGTTTGVTDATRATFKFTASNGSATITKLRFDDVSGNSGISSVRVGTMTGGMAGGVAYLTGLSIPVANGGSGANIDAYASYAPVGATGLTSPTATTLRLCYVEYTIGGMTTTAGSVACGGAGTGILGSNGVTSGQPMLLVASKPTITVASPAGILTAAGANEALDVTVTASTGGDIQINSFVVNSAITGGTVYNVADVDTTTGATANSIFVKDTNNSILATSATALGATSGGSSTITLTGGYTVTAGQSVTFRVYIPVNTVTNPSGAHTSSLSSSLGAAVGFSWTDISGGAVTAQTTNNTTYLYNYPTNSVSLTS